MSKEPQPQLRMCSKSIPSLVSSDGSGSRNEPFAQLFPIFSGFGRV
jgi:hypothetical protein